MKPIAIFFHCVFFNSDGTKRIVESPYVGSGPLIQNYVKDLKASGLYAAATRFFAGINGGDESVVYAKCYIPEAEHLMHGTDCRSSNLTSEAMRVFAVEHPGWNIFHFHAKGIAHNIPQYATYHEFEGRWIRCMVKHCIQNWRTCVADLEEYDSVGCHWMPNVGVPPVDHIWGGTFFWATSDFIATLPPLAECPLVKKYGMKSWESRATSEQYIGLGPKLPRIKDYHPNGIGACP